MEQLVSVRSLFKETEKFAGQTVKVGGWVRNLRASKNFGFINLSDGTFFSQVQIVYGAELPNFAEISKLNIGAAVIVTGTLVLTPDAKQPFEVQAAEIAVEGPSTPDFPIQPKTDEERFHEIFTKKVGTTPGAYLRRKLAAGVPEGELRRMYDMLAVELARTAHCKAIRFDEALGQPDAKSVHTQRAANSRVPVCPKCGAQMVLRTGQSGARKGQKFWGCSNYPACRYTKNVEPRG